MALLVAPSVRLIPPSGDPPPGGGFYQLDEDRLYVQVGPTGHDRHYFSFLEAENVRLDFDRHARLMFIEVAVPRRQWTCEDDLTPPLITEPSDVTWLDFRTAIAPPGLSTDLPRTTLSIRFRAAAAARTVVLAKRVLLEVGERDQALALWVTGIEDDVAGREIAAYRRRHAPDPA